MRSPPRSACCRRWVRPCCCRPCCNLPPTPTFLRGGQQAILWTMPIPPNSHLQTPPGDDLPIMHRSNAARPLARGLAPFFTAPRLLTPPEFQPPCRRPPHPFFPPPTWPHTHA